MKRYYIASWFDENENPPSDANVPTLNCYIIQAETEEAAKRKMLELARPLLLRHGPAYNASWSSIKEFSICK